MEIEIAGERWRLRKRFLADRMAELVSLSTGAVTRGSDAEARLEELLDLRSAAGRFPLLWLAQGALLTADEPDRDGESLLRSAITREVTAAAGGEGGRRVRARVQATLSEFVTAGRGQPKGAYLEAMRAADAASAELDKCRSMHAEVEGLLDRLANLGEASAKLSDAGVRAARVRRIVDAEARLKQAHEDVSARDAARVKLAEARAIHVEAAATAHTLVASLAELASLDALATGDAAAARDLQHRLQASEHACDEAAEAVAQARSGLDMAEADLEQARVAARYREAVSRISRARELDARISSTSALLRGLPLEEAPVREARRLSARLSEAAVRLDASSSAVTVTYEPDPAATVVVDGRPVADGERLLVTGRLELHVPGVGRISVEPGASSELERLLASQDADRSALTRILAEFGATDVADLERRYSEARSLAAELAEVRAALAAVAPDGKASLEKDLAALASPRGGAHDPPSPLDPARLAESVASGHVALQAADAALRQHEAAREMLRREAAVQASRTEERSKRHAEVEAGLPPLDTRARLRSEVEARADAASRALDEALRIEAAWAQRTPDAVALAKLEAELAEARHDLQRSEQEEASLNAERARIEGNLEAARREDIAARIAELEADAERTRARQLDLAEEVSALQLLDVELGAEEARLRDSYLAPVLARLAPYVDLVFPSASLKLGEKYAAAGLVRGEREEALDRLSDGTREQIAVLTRLAFARLLVDQGMGAPLILDDVLVYSDDRRIVAMHRALEVAAEAHQVIVLSCREQSFSGLRGARISLVPWTPDAR